MQAVKRIINITGNKIYLTPSHYFAITDTNLAAGQITFRHNHNIYWEIEYNTADYDLISNTLTIRISNYYPSSIANFDSQQIKGTITRLDFKGVDWIELEKHLSSYKKKPLLVAKTIIDKSDVTPPRQSSFTKTTAQFIPTPPKTTFEPPPQPRVENKSVNFDVAFDDATFEDGQVSFLHFFSWSKTPVLFTIKNNWILPEYDLIKEYFVKALSRKTFSVKASLTITNGTITEKAAVSQEIQKINAELIDKIILKRTLQLATSPIKREKQTLYTDTDIFTNFEQPGADANIFSQSGVDILELILTVKKARNELHLKFLSSTFHNHAQKLRFTLNPLFGFVFYQKQQTHHIFCWELLNSHATYVWLIDNETHRLDSALSILEEELAVVEQLGREQYRKGIKENKPDNFIFYKVDHTNINQSDEGFENWKQKIEKIMR